MVPPAIGIKRGCGGMLAVLSLPAGVRTDGYWTTCVLIGVRDDGWLGTTGFGWLTTVDGAGLPLLIMGCVMGDFVMVGCVMAGCVIVGCVFAACVNV